MRHLANLSLMRLLSWLVLPISLSRPARGQDLAPRAYLITPIRSNAITLTYGFSNGNMNLDGSVPVTDATVSLHTPVVSYVRSLSFFGRSANVLGALPYGVGDFSGNVLGSQTATHRSGLLPATFRFSVNLMGGPSMDVRQFVKWQQKLLIGASIKVLPPTGQYDPEKLINLGINRWALKPEVGLSRRWNHWLLDTYGGVWFYTENPEFFSHNAITSGVHRQTQSPMGSFEGHFSYDVRPRLWASLDGNFWFGGASAIDGKTNSLTTNRNSRVGGTVSFPVTKRQSIKFSYSDGAYIRYGGNYKNVSAGWQYSWITKR
ncbi:transporter [Occallatibacter riparius]|uniref:Transporter n=1 Tax=Occallatibacter riparius TaxID=1002689 RepID=A0A9J7BT66_9BACT|nr:transporter [Occallatibacter riparius]UWZ86068.1 transporter [Occallatibacter riparius]